MRLHDPPLIVKMPSCQGKGGTPYAMFQPGAVYMAEDPPMHRFLIGEALAVLERARHHQHGDTFPLPSLDPADWRLAPTDQRHVWLIEPA